MVSNIDLLGRVRHDFPDAYLIYKPHPDVVAGLRPGDVTDPPADQICLGDAAQLLEKADRVATITSTLGFEALLRDVPVTTYGAPFYAGWGLTDDRGPLPKELTTRRQARPNLDQLTHACLIDYPRYLDPVTGRPASPELIIDRLASGAIPSSGAATKILAKAQGLFASYAYLWRR